MKEKSKASPHHVTATRSYKSGVDRLLRLPAGAWKIVYLKKPNTVRIHGGPAVEREVAKAEALKAGAR